MDLSGWWRAAPRSPELDRAGADPDFDDANWTDVEVPGHWGEVGSFADEDGPVVYRRHFDLRRAPAGRRAWLRFDGVMSEADVWLDGHHLGDIDLYFAPHRFDITELLACSDGPEAGPTSHVLAAEVSCPDGGDGPKRSMTGSLRSGSLAPPGSPGGLWRGVAIDETGPVAISRARVLCTRADEAEAELTLRAMLDADGATSVRIDTSIVGPDGWVGGDAAIHDVASGENHIEWTTTVPNPKLWWPASFGEQPRYDVGITVRTGLDVTGGGTGEVSDRRLYRTGLRTVSVDGLRWRVNDQPIFIKAISVGPHGRFLGSVSAEQLRDDVRAVRDAGLDLIRVHGHLTRSELYEAADELGVLIWQDLPLVGSYTTRARSAAREVARAAVDVYGHHPSIAVWCGHDEPNGPALAAPTSDAEAPTRIGRRLGRHLLPSWNRSVLDPVVRRELRSADPSRAVITRSGSLPNPIESSGSDAHLWLGWRAGRASDLADLARRWPRLATFVGAIGTQSVTVADWDDDEPAWPTAERGSFDRYVPRAAYADGRSWALATQAYQADVIRSQIETVRRLKYNPAGGFCVVSLFDAEPAGGFGLLEADRTPKPAFDVLTDACRPVVIIADQPDAVVTRGQRVSLAIHAVNDLPDELGAVRVTARARIDRWRSTKRWGGALGADSCAFIGRLDFVVPDVTGALHIDLELEADERSATNRYRTIVIPPAEAVGPPSSRARQT